MIRVLVLRMPAVATNPVPLHLMTAHGADGFLPKREVLDRSALASPTPRNPCRHPRAHSFDNVPRVAGKDDAKRMLLAIELAKRLDDRPQRHAVIRRRRFENPIVPSLDEGGFRIEQLDYAARTTRIATLAAISEARFVSVNRD